MKLSRHAAFFVLLLCLLSWMGYPRPTRAVAESPSDPATIEVPKDLADFRAIEARVKAVAAKALPAVVGTRIGASSGSGVIVSEDGIVMTAGHVVDKPGQPVLFIFADGKTAKGTTLGMCSSTDIGLMKITDPGKWPTMPMGHSDSVKAGSWCVACGHPLGYKPGRPPVVRVGRIIVSNDTVIRTDCPLVGGDSGGPLFDLEGNVIGINSRIGRTADFNLHAPVDVFRRSWDRLLKGEAWTEMPLRRDGADVKKPLRDVVKKAGQCVVRVKCDGKDVALGTIVGPDGWVLTKASELKGKIVCRLRDGRDLEGRVVGVCLPLDLAMLKIDALNLPSIPWAMNGASVGQWILSAGMDEDPLAIGIVSVPRRAIPPISGAIGIMLNGKEKSVKVAGVAPNSPAAKAGLKANDIITHVNGDAVADAATARKLLQSHKPGETIKLTIRRGDKTLDFSVKMAKLSSRRAQIMNSLGVGVSRRSDDFPAVVQHDTVLKPTDCGGPAVDLQGNVIGVNIAHAGRTETYCLPADVLLVSMYEMMSGRLSPALLQAAEKKTPEKAAGEKAAEEKTPPEKRPAPREQPKKDEPETEKAPPMGRLISLRQ